MDNSIYREEWWRKEDQLGPFIAIIQVRAKVAWAKNGDSGGKKVRNDLMKHKF